MKLLKTREAAKLLAISERTLWKHTQPRGPIPVIRIGDSVRYSADALSDYVKSQLNSSSNEMADAC